MSRTAIGALFLTALVILFFFVPRGESIETYDNLVLSKLGVTEILKYIEASDHERGLSEEQLAAKYILGEIPEDRETPARAVMYWKSMAPSEQRQLKVVWFREHYRRIAVEDVSKHVNIDYLKARAGGEFRENPLIAAPKPKKEDEEDAKKKKGPKLKPLKVKKPKTTTDTVTVKKTSMTAKPAGKSKTPVAAPTKPSAQKTDTTPPGKPESLLKKIPWYGLPTSMKNE